MIGCWNLGDQTILKIWAVSGGRKWGGNCTYCKFLIWLKQFLYLENALALLKSCIKHVITVEGVVHGLVKECDIVVEGVISVDVLVFLWLLDHCNFEINKLFCHCITQS